MSSTSILSTAQLFEQFHSIQIDVDVDDVDDIDTRRRIEQPKPTLPFPVAQLKKRIVEIAKQNDQEQEQQQQQQQEDSCPSTTIFQKAETLTRLINHDFTKVYSPPYLNCVSSLSLTREDPFVFDIFSQHDIGHKVTTMNTNTSNNNNQLHHQYNKTLISVDILQPGLSGRADTMEVKTTILCSPEDKIIRDIASNPQFVRCFNQYHQRAQSKAIDDLLNTTTENNNNNNNVRNNNNNSNTKHHHHHQLLLASYALPMDSSNKRMTSLFATYHREGGKIGKDNNSSTSALSEEDTSEAKKRMIELLNTHNNKINNHNYDDNDHDICIGDLSVGTVLVYRHLGLSCDHLISITGCESVPVPVILANNDIDDDNDDDEKQKEASTIKTPFLVFTRKIGNTISHGVTNSSSGNQRQQQNSSNNLLTSSAYFPMCDGCRIARAQVVLYGCRLVPNHPTMLCDHCNTVLHHCSSSHEDDDCCVMKI